MVSAMPVEVSLLPSKESSSRLARDDNESKAQGSGTDGRVQPNEAVEIDHLNPINGF